jgi:hypothetical protein
VVAMLLTDRIILAGFRDIPFHLVSYGIVWDIEINMLFIRLFTPISEKRFQEKKGTITFKT